MKKYLFCFGAAVLMLGSPALAKKNSTKEGKVDVCHRRPDMPDKISINSVKASAVADHLAHGDNIVGPETCNGIDDNCDGTVDDNPSDAGGTCTVGVGACTVTGTEVCDGGVLTCSTDGQTCDARMVSGQVTDPAGIPIEGAQVRSMLAEATTEEGGIYNLQNVEELERVVLVFEKEGFATTYGIVDFGAGSGAMETLNKVMLPAGPPQTVNAQDGGTVEQDGSKVTFPADSIDTTGEVQVVLTPLDPSTVQIGAFPGDFAAQTAGGDPALLESFALFDVQITQNGAPVNLAAGTMAELEFLLPANTPLEEGDLIPLWFFNVDTGLWQEEGVGTVGPSTATPGRLAIFGQVSHFSWWNADLPIDTFSCLTGTVEDSAGNMVAGAQVFGYGVDYNGVSDSGTGASGNYCMDVRINSAVNVSASLVSGGVVILISNTVQVSTGASNVTCDTGGCVPVPTLTLNGVSCVTGRVVDLSGTVIPGAAVTSSGGGFATTDGTGGFCFVAPADSSVTVGCSGFTNAFDFMTGAAGGTCGGGGCTAVGDIPCLQPTYTCTKPIDLLSMVWNGTQTVDVKAWKGVIGSTLLAVVDNVVPGQVVTVGGFDGGPNDVIWEIYEFGATCDAGGCVGTKIGESTFHLSCSDPDMNGPEDCCQPQGDGKDKLGFVNDWLLVGIVDAGGALGCTCL